MDLDTGVLPGLLHDVADQSIDANFTGNIKVIIRKEGAERFLLTAYPDMNS